ncbi:hypothetical protein [uncultured Corynebacterium sp.]|uniref:hypothetical protein n=1 Tax=uncultured Corynebacterium sp. TaxID=159447 RepID=UPI002599FA46|nr:hypothetical protein [uncultured Corynebacterium sp.]
MTTNPDKSDNPARSGRAQAGNAEGEPPAVLRFGAIVVLVQCAALFAYALWLAVTNLRGVADNSVESESAAAQYVGVGTAVFIVIVFGFVAYSAVRMFRGRSTGSGAIVLIEAILIGVAFYMFSGGAVLLGLVTLLSAALALAMIFHPASWEYSRAAYARR